MSSSTPSTAAAPSDQAASSTPVSRGQVVATLSNLVHMLHAAVASSPAGHCWVSAAMPRGSREVLAAICQAGVLAAFDDLMRTSSAAEEQRVRALATLEFAG